MELTTIRRVGGCIQLRCILDLLFLDNLPILNVRMVTKCKKKLTDVCAFGVCPRYKVGTAGKIRISWDNPGARA